ncbi:outer membrane protein [Flavobacterium ponti]|uniref:Outer membrane protein n=1 Tax=Flavobacterium ponti TaxID=665133 RepID=A0ABV9P727_9FLAO
MKKLLLSAVMLFGIAISANAQDISKNALGLRLGDNDGFGGEISYQRGLSGNNRLELDLGFRNSKDVDAFKLAGLYQWVWNIEGGFNWYAGVGGGIGSWSYDRRIGNDRYKDSGTILFVAGDLGIEYNFDEAPIQLSLDIRPELYFNSDDYREDNFGPDIALGIRYRFN